MITWESQAVDYPSIGPGYARVRAARLPARSVVLLVHVFAAAVKYPYVRGSLLEMFREARARPGDPVDAWAEIVDDPEKARARTSAARQGRASCAPRGTRRPS